MKRVDIVVVGGSAAGLTTALTARRHYPERSILLIRREKQVSIPCGIPYAFGIVGKPEKNLIPLDDTLEKNKIETIVGEVTALDREAKLVTCADGQQVAYELGDRVATAL